MPFKQILILIDIMRPKSDIFCNIYYDFVLFWRESMEYTLHWDFGLVTPLDHNWPKYFTHASKPWSPILYTEKGNYGAICSIFMAWDPIASNWHKIWLARVTVQSRCNKHTQEPVRRNTQLIMATPTVGKGVGVQYKVLSGEAPPEVQALTLLYTILTEMVPLSFTLYWKKVTHLPTWEHYTPFSKPSELS